MHIASTSLLRPVAGSSLLMGYSGESYMRLPGHHGKALLLGRHTKILVLCFEECGTLVEEATRRFLFTTGLPDIPTAREGVERMVQALVEAEALEASEHEDEMFGTSMAEAYERYRQIPEIVSKIIVASVPIRASSRILDVATGTGELARQLAHISAYVTGLDISKSFLRVAVQKSNILTNRPSFLMHSGNHLSYLRRRFDVVCLAQAFHWLDPVQFIRGALNVLSREGMLVCVESKVYLPSGHPLRELFGYGKELDDGMNQAFLAQEERYSVWFEAFASRYHDSLYLSHTWYAKEERSYSAEFARAFFPPQLVADVLERHSYKNLEAVFDGFKPEQLQGFCLWQVLFFRRLSYSRK